MRPSGRPLARWLDANVSKTVGAGSAEGRCRASPSPSSPRSTAGVGHGVELVMACDIRIASDRAQFGTFEVRRGMHPADGGIPRLVNTCGVGVALEMLLTGEPISAERALTANMVARVVPHEKLMEETDAVVQRSLRCDQAAIESLQGDGARDHRPPAVRPAAR